MLSYNLYRDSTHYEVLVDGTGNTFTLTGIGGYEFFTVHGHIPALTNAIIVIRVNSAVVTIEW